MDITPYDRRSALRRGAAVVLFLLALALLAPGLFGLAWDAQPPAKFDYWLLVALAALYLAAGVAVMLVRAEIRKPGTRPKLRFLWAGSRTARERTRIELALAFSLFVHALVLSLRFGIPGLGIPGLEFPWAERRVQATDLTVRFAEAPPPVSAPALPGIALRMSAPPDTFTVRQPQPGPRKAPNRKMRADPKPKVLAQRERQPDTFKVPAPKRAEPVQQRTPPAVEKSEEPIPAMQAEDATQKEAEELARQRALTRDKEQEAKKVEDAKRAEEARRVEEAKRVEETRKQELAKVQEEQLKQEAIRKQEEAKRIAALEVEALKRAEEIARQQAAQRQKELEAKRLAEEASRAKEAADRQRAEAEAAAQRERDRARLAAPSPGAPGPGTISGSELAQRAIDQVRREPARVEPKPTAPLPPPVAENPRRRSIFGVERDVGLRMYVESWRTKIERNGSFNYKAAASRRAYQNPIATVSIRSDGTLESVSINQSSGVRELDQAVLDIAKLFAPYSKFPPAMARQYDIIDIQREWFFDNTLRILDVTSRN